MDVLRRSALVLFGCLTACSGHGPLAFHAISDRERESDANIPADATVRAKIPLRGGDVLVLTQEQCSRRFQMCVYAVARHDAAGSGPRLGTIVGSHVDVTGLDRNGMPTLDVDGESCAFVAAPTVADPHGSYVNVELSGNRGTTVPETAWVNAPAALVKRANLRARLATPPYRSTVVDVLSGHARATIVEGGEHEMPPFTIFAGAGSAGDRELLVQTGTPLIGAAGAHDSHDIGVRRTYGTIWFRYDGRRYVPAPCQSDDALRPDASSLVE